MAMLKKAGELIISGAIDFIAKPFRAEQLRHVCSIAAHREDFIISNEQFKEKQNALIEEKSRAQITLESIADGVITTDVSGKIDYANPIAEKLLNESLDDLISRSIDTVFHTYHEVSESQLQTLLSGPLQKTKLSIQLPTIF